MTDSDIHHLCPELLLIYREWMMQCTENGLVVRAIVTWRNAAEQNAAKAQGLSNAAAGQSPHNCCDSDGRPFSKAFDFAVFQNGVYITDGEDRRYTRAGEIGEKLGLQWGGRWHHPDYDHLELRNWKPV